MVNEAKSTETKHMHGVPSLSSSHSKQCGDSICNHCQTTKPEADQSEVHETAHTIKVKREWTPKWMTVLFEEENRNLWTRCFVVIDELGTLMVFEDETMTTMITSFILNKLTLNNFTFNGPEPHFPLIRLQMEAQGQRLHFLFDAAVEHREFMEWMRRSIVLGNDEGICSLTVLRNAVHSEYVPVLQNQRVSDSVFLSEFTEKEKVSDISLDSDFIKNELAGQRVDFLGEPGHLFLTEKNTLQQFADAAKVSLKSEVKLQNVFADNVLAVGQSAFIVVQHGTTEPVLFWTENGEERDLWIEILQNRIAILNQIDFTLFEQTSTEMDIERDDECNGSDSPAVHRIVQTLNLFAALNSSSAMLPEAHGDGPEAVLTAFCNEHYPKRALLRDYVEFMDKHSAPQTVRDIAGRLNVDCGGVSRCNGTRRHFRERGDSKENDDEKDGDNVYVETLDSLHFFLCHLEDMGLRVAVEVLQSTLCAVEEELDEDSLVDAILKRMALEIAARRKLLSVKRLDGVSNTKFNISTKKKKMEIMSGLFSLLIH